MTREDLIHLEIMTPSDVVVDAMASQVSAEASNGSFTLLPRHIDLAATLVPGLLSYVAEGREHLLAVDAGVLVKRGPSVRVATGDAVPGEGVLELQRVLRSAFKQTTESEHKARSALARLETDTVRRLLELEDHD